MLAEDDLDLAAQYYRLRMQYICNQHILENYRQYGALAPFLDQFSALCTGFIHDLVNGLSVIQGRLESLSRVSVDSQYVQKIAQAKCLCMVCTWRVYALAEISPSVPKHLRTINLPEFVSALLDTVATWYSPSVSVSFHTTVSDLSVASYDEGLRLVLLEPLLNAFQAMSNGGHVTVSLQKLDTRLAQIEIIDTGPGLQIEDLERCFDLRYTTSHRPYGLGLYVARRVVEKHGGTCTVHSEPLKGVKVVVKLPVDDLPDWRDENSLVQGLEVLHDSIVEQGREIEARHAIYSTSRDETLARLSDLFGQLCSAMAQFVESGISHVRELLIPLVEETAGDIANSIQFVLEKCDYCEVLLGSVRALDPTSIIHFVPLDLNQVADQAIQLVKWRVQPGTQLRWVPTDASPIIEADRLLLATALVHLLRNALDVAGRDGKVVVETQCVEEVATIRLVNTGQAIPSDLLARVFDLDFTTRPDRAFGMGLYVARVIVAKCNGSITVRDEQQASTALEIIVPRYTGAV